MTTRHPYYTFTWLQQSLSKRMVELRKRKVAEQPPAVEKRVKKTATTAKASTGASGKGRSISATSPASIHNVGDRVALDDFGGQVETNDGKQTTLKELVNSSQSGVVLFTYPKASTPGCKLFNCFWRMPSVRILAAIDRGLVDDTNMERGSHYQGTKQACMFRDSYDHLTSTGLSIYGLSADSPKANTTFKTKQKLPYPLLCDPTFGLIAALGLKKSPKGTIRGVFAINKSGEVLLSHKGGPDATVEATRQLVAKWAWWSKSSISTRIDFPATMTRHSLGTELLNIGFILLKARYLVFLDPMQYMQQWLDARPSRSYGGEGIFCLFNHLNSIPNEQIK